MADVHVLDILTVLHGGAGTVGDIVDGPDGIGIGKGVVAAIHAEVDTPHQLGAVAEILTDARQNLAVHAAVVQNKTLAVVQNL